MFVRACVCACVRACMVNSFTGARVRNYDGACDAYVFVRAYMCACMRICVRAYVSGLACVYVWYVY